MESFNSKEEKNTNEQFSEAKQKLLSLEKSDNYVFHGSGLVIEEFEPRQAHNYIDGKQVPDGEPAIFASSKAEYAIFMGIINKENCPKGRESRVGEYGEDIRFMATKDTLSQIEDTTSGWVYVFNKSDFSQRYENGIVYTSALNAKPIDKIQVTKKDLPDNIEIIG